MNELAQPFADLADQLEFVTAERDRLRDAVEIYRVEVEHLRSVVQMAADYLETPIGILVVDAGAKPNTPSRQVQMYVALRAAMEEKK